MLIFANPIHKSSLQQNQQLYHVLHTPYSKSGEKNLKYIRKKFALRIALNCT